MLNALDAIQRPRDRRSLDTVVYLGAGSGTELDAILNRSPRRLIAVEGDMDQAAALRRRFASRPTVELHAEVLSPHAGPRSWHRHNLRRLNGLLQPEGPLRQAYPRLRTLGMSTVDTLAMGSWLDRLSIDSAGEGDDNNLLVFDIAGSEGPLLASLDERHLDAFPWIAVRSSAQSSYVGGSTLAEVRAMLVQFGYDVVAADEREVLWPLELYHADSRARKLTRVQRQLVAATANLELRDQQLAEAGQKVRELADAIERATTDMASLRAEHARSDASHRDQLATLTSRMEQMTRELAQTQAAAAQAVKFQRLREADLADLRARYEVLQADDGARQALLQQLGQRLGAIHEQFSRLAAVRGHGHPVAEDPQAFRSDR